MINIYSPNNTDYEHNGDATLQAISCDLSIKINGAWQLELEVPYDAEGRWKLIEEGAVIQTDIGCIREINTRQRFRIYDYRKTQDSVIAIAFPVAMESTHDAPIANLIIDSRSGIQAMQMLQEFTDKYTLSSDISKVASTSFQNTNVNNAIASGDDNSFIEVYGGEILYDNLNYFVKNKLGSDTDIEPVIYGRNIKSIKYEKDDSGVATRLHPISSDGLRLNLNDVDYVDSPRIGDYPIIRSRYISVPYVLVDTREESPSRTAQFTRSMITALTEKAYNLSRTALSDSTYEIEYIKQNKDEIISAIQEMCILTITMESMQKIIFDCINEGMAWIKDEQKPPYDWHGSYSEGWWYGYNEEWKVKGRYELINSKWNKFDSDGIWIESSAQDSKEWGWYQPPGASNVKYGNFNNWYARDEWVYQYLDEGQHMRQYWIDAGGWYKDVEEYKQDTTWAWYVGQNGKWWFGEEGATSEDPDKFAHDEWLYINGYRYYFDHDGYNTDTIGYDKVACSWGWITTDNVWWWFGTTDKEADAVYLQNQWAKIDGTWRYFGADGYVQSEDSAVAALVNYFKGAMAELASDCISWNSDAYSLLYSLMVEYCNKQYDQNIDLPVVNIDVNMVDLSKTSEYKDYQQLAKICLGDEVETRDYIHNISANERVIGLTYDCIRQFNKKVEIGAPGNSFTNLLKTNAGGEAVTTAFDTTGIEHNLVAFSNEIGSLDARKQNKLTAGQNIEIINDVISARGRGLQYWTETKNGFFRYTTDTDDTRVDVYPVLGENDTYMWMDQKYSWSTLETMVYAETNSGLVTPMERVSGIYSAGTTSVIYYPTTIVGTKGTTTKNKSPNLIYNGLIVGDVDDSDPHYPPVYYIRITPTRYSEEYASKTIENSQGMVYTGHFDRETGAVTVDGYVMPDSNQNPMNYSIIRNHIVYNVQMFRFSTYDIDIAAELQTYGPCYVWNAETKEYERETIPLNGVFENYDLPWTLPVFQSDRYWDKLEACVSEVIDSLNFHAIRPNLGKGTVTGMYTSPRAPRFKLGEYDGNTETIKMWVDKNYYVHAEGYYIGEDTPIGGGGGGGSEVSISDLLTSGTKVATVTIDDEDFEILAPDVDVNQTLTSGTEIAQINGTSIYAPAGGGGSDPIGYVREIQTVNVDGGTLSLSGYNYNLVRPVLKDASNANFVITESGYYLFKAIVQIKANGTTALSVTDAAKWIKAAMSITLSSTKPTNAVITDADTFIKQPAIIYSGDVINTQMEISKMLYIPLTETPNITPALRCFVGGNLSSAYYVTATWQIACYKIGG